MISQLLRYKNVFYYIGMYTFVSFGFGIKHINLTEKCRKNFTKRVSEKRLQIIIKGST